MQPSPHYGDPSTANAHAAADGSRVISLFVFNTDVHLHAYAPDGADPADPAVAAELDGALAACRDRCLYFERRLSRTRPDSDISRAHAASPDPVPVAPETADLTRRALGYCAASGGRFDITMGTVTSLWDFHAGTVPSRRDIARALPHVGFRHIAVGEGEGGAPTLAIDDPRTVLDLGGIAKGYVADRLVELLRDRTDATAAMISLGGNIALYGTKPDGSPWDIGVRDPNDPGGSSIVGTAHVEGGMSLVTSGLYERTFELDGVTYWHILDPRTGMPVATDTESVTVACPSSTAADALSTTLFVAGSARGCEIADGRADTGAYFLLEGGGAASSAAWDELTDFEV